MSNPTPEDLKAARIAARQRRYHARRVAVRKAATSQIGRDYTRYGDDQLRHEILHCLLLLEEELRGLSYPQLYVAASDALRAWLERDMRGLQLQIPLPDLGEPQQEANNRH